MKEYSRKPLYKPLFNYTRDCLSNFIAMRKLACGNKQKDTAQMSDQYSTGYLNV